MEQKRQHFYEFGPFVLDTVQHLLLRERQPVPLTPKTYDTLLVLVESGGRMLSKDELMKALWPDSFVEESNLTVQISTIRKALGEVPGEHRYIVTVPGRGYRFSANVRGWSQERADVIIEDHSRGEMVVEELEEGSDEELEDGTQAETPEPALYPTLQTQVAPARRRGLILLRGAGLALALGILFVALRPPLPLPRVLQYKELTASGRVDPVSKILTDGTRVYFVARPPDGTRVTLNQVASDGTEAAEIPVPLKEFFLCAISPDHSQLILGSAPRHPFAIRCGQCLFWVVPRDG
jgi:DNA-binding winged helix-turn-helix (wHTH) protein